uniref:Uncharacterized protein n=1 Tax=Anguilla anguilla TaxID=7936 RepID=A0A0E9V962_ANGAN
MTLSALRQSGTFCGPSKVLRDRSKAVACTQKTAILAHSEK